MEAQLQQLQQKFQEAEAEIKKVICGQEEAVRFILLSVLASGHALITGAPGLAKTLAVKAVSQVLGLKSNRIQFTPDLLPGDIIGIEVLDYDQESGQKQFRYIQGPVFANILIADEINRTTPRTQSALLEAMQERNVSIGGKDWHLEEPFMVFATRNPIDSEGVYPLPEAQLDRFLMEIVVQYPNLEQEMAIAAMDFSKELVKIDKKITKQELLGFQEMVDQVPIPESVMKKAIQWLRQTRPGDVSAPQEVKEFLEWGASPRSAYHLIHVARAYSLLYGEGVVSESDVKKVFPAVMRHRVIPSAIFTRTGKEIDELLAKITAS